MSNTFLKQGLSSPGDIVKSRNLRERENENVKDRVRNIIDYLKVKHVFVEAAERKTNNYDSKPGVILGTFRSYEDKEQVLKAKKHLKDSTRYHDVYIENDVPAHQRQLKNNLCTIVNTLGKERLKLRGSRIIRAEENTGSDNCRNDSENGHQERNRNTDNNHYPYESRRPSSSRPYHVDQNKARGQRYINITRNAIGPKSGQKDCRKF